MIGRRSSCDVTLRFPNVSSHHCELSFENGFWRIRDLGSTNGIKVNGERCDSHWLSPGDELQVAKHSFKIAYEPLGDAPPPSSHEEDVLAVGLLEKAGLAKTEPDRSSGEIPARRPPRRPPAEAPPLSEDEDAAFEFLTDDWNDD